MPLSSPGSIDWNVVKTRLDDTGFASLGRLLDAPTCSHIIKNYDDDTLYRSTINMARHNFGRGQYRYFTYPLPGLIQTLRQDLYPHLAAIANDWTATLGTHPHYPPSHADFIKHCHAEKQTRPTPLVLRYGPGDYNCLHQDLYGDILFPLQIVIMLSNPKTDFTGGEFVATEQRPRMQSRAHVVPLVRGEAVVFAVNERPVQGRLRPYRVKMRHGVSTLVSGTRHTLGIIFHDAR